MRDRLPVLPVPLRAPNPDLMVDLQEVFETTFERGLYARTLDYADPPPGPWGEEDRAWIAERVRCVAR